MYTQQEREEATRSAFRRYDLTPQLRVQAYDLLAELNLIDTKQSECLCQGVREKGNKKIACTTHLASDEVAKGLEGVLSVAFDHSVVGEDLKAVLFEQAKHLLCTRSHKKDEQARRWVEKAFGIIETVRRRHSPNTAQQQQVVSGAEHTSVSRSERDPLEPQVQAIQSRQSRFQLQLGEVERDRRRPDEEVEGLADQVRALQQTNGVPQDQLDKMTRCKCDCRRQPMKRSESANSGNRPQTPFGFANVRRSEDDQETASISDEDEEMVQIFPPEQVRPRIAENRSGGTMVRRGHRLSEFFPLNFERDDGTEVVDSDLDVTLGSEGMELSGVDVKGRSSLVSRWFGWLF